MKWEEKSEQGFCSHLSLCSDLVLMCVHSDGWANSHIKDTREILRASNIYDKQLFFTLTGETKLSMAKYQNEPIWVNRISEKRCPARANRIRRGVPRRCRRCSQRSSGIQNMQGNHRSISRPSAVENWSFAFPSLVETGKQLIRPAPGRAFQFQAGGFFTRVSVHGWNQQCKLSSSWSMWW
jgi:hypothetical protein